MITIKEPEEIAALREGGACLAQIVKEVSQLAQPGVLTSHLDAVAESLMYEAGGEPSLLGYKPSGARRPFPATLCISVNNEIVHGIPTEDPVELAEGDIVTIDSCFTYKNMVTDHAWTVPVGEIDSETKRLLSQTEETLYAGIKQARSGNWVGDISATIQNRAQKYNLGIVRELAGHGVGYSVHEEPLVLNFGRAGTGVQLQPGMVIAVEPIFSLGSGRMYVGKDGYTCLTSDDTNAAQFEHTVLITHGDPEILTKV